LLRRGRFIPDIITHRGWARRARTTVIAVGAVTAAITATTATAAATAITAPTGAFTPAFKTQIALTLMRAFDIAVYIVIDTIFIRLRQTHVEIRLVLIFAKFFTRTILVLRAVFIADILAVIILAIFTTAPTTAAAATATPAAAHLPFAPFFLTRSSSRRRTARLLLTRLPLFAGFTMLALFARLAVTARFTRAFIFVIITVGGGGAHRIDFVTSWGQLIINPDHHLDLVSFLDLRNHIALVVQNINRHRRRNMQMQFRHLRPCRFFLHSP
jgi:hypothetical protein